MTLIRKGIGMRAETYQEYLERLQEEYKIILQEINNTRNNLEILINETSKYDKEILKLVSI